MGDLHCYPACIKYNSHSCGDGGSATARMVPLSFLDRWSVFAVNDWEDEAIRAYQKSFGATVLWPSESALNLPKASMAFIYTPRSSSLSMQATNGMTSR